MFLNFYAKFSVLLSIILIIIAFFSSSAQGSEKVAVLHFTDHSRFDSGGLLSFWPFNVIFGTGQKREKWDLKAGFRDILSEELTKAGYDVIEPGYIDKILQEAEKENMGDLASKLDAEIMIVGDIRKFEQHRARASSQGPTKLSPESGTMDSMGMVAMGGVGGFFYSATVNTHVIIYDSAGEELENSDFNSKKDLRDFYMGVGPLTYHKGDKEDKIIQKEPIVDYKKLDAMKFGTDEFKNDTLFGLATMDVMDKIIARLGEHLSSSELTSVQGKIIYVGTGDRLKENEVYINLGASDGIKPGIRLGVYAEGLRLTDPDSGEELGNVPEERIGEIKITRVEAEHLSIAEVMEKTGQIGRGNIVKRE